MKLYRRENYLSKIRGFYHDTELTKVITGIRRSIPFDLNKYGYSLCITDTKGSCCVLKIRKYGGMKLNSI